MSATHDLLLEEATLRPGQRGEYSWFVRTDREDLWQFPAGIEAEAGEFLYGLVRMLKPVNVLETGTSIGMSSRYIALGLRHNHFGHLITLERMPNVFQVTKQRLIELKLCGPWITPLNIDAREYTPDRDFGLMWLDSEPEYRLGELDRFLPRLQPGGVACIHDMRDPWMKDSPFGKMPMAVRSKFEDLDMSEIHFPNDTGLTVFQKHE
jgi:predicted O-methyltransferase YrrM